MSKQFKKVIISRKKWLRGGRQPSQLRICGLQCCMGFVARAEGYTVKDLEKDDSGYPSYLDNSLACFPPELLRREEAIACVNDDQNLSEPERERKVKAMLRKCGYDVRFVP